MSKQSKSGWGGKREGAGAPSGNTNAMKHGERSKRAFFPLEGGDDLTPLVRNRVRNLLLAECLGVMRREGRLYSGRPADWREQMLLEGMMWQHTREIIRLERSAALLNLKQARAKLAEARWRLCEEKRAAREKTMTPRDTAVQAVAGPEHEGRQFTPSGRGIPI